MARKFVACPNCGYRNTRAGGRRKCVNCGEALPKRRVPGHAKQLRDVPYTEWAYLSQVIHGGELHACGVCGKLPEFGRKCDRDHDHENGRIRGLACGGDFGCNRMMPRKLTAARARTIAELMARHARLPEVFAPYLPRDLTTERAEQIACYLERVDDHYAAASAAVSGVTEDEKGQLPEEQVEKVMRFAGDYADRVTEDGKGDAAASAYGWLEGHAKMNTDARGLLAALQELSALAALREDGGAG